MKTKLSIAVAVAFSTIQLASAAGSGDGYFVAEDGCYKQVAGGTDFGCTPGSQGVFTGAQLGSDVPNITQGVNATIFSESGFGEANNSILIGNLSTMGVADSGAGLINPGGNVSIGSNSEMYGGGNVSYGSFGRVNGMFSTAIGQGAQVGDVLLAGDAGYVLRGVALGSYSSATNDYAVAIGSNARATGYSSVALGAGTVAFEDNTVAVGGRRVTGLSDAVNFSDAVTLGQMSAITDAMSVQISNLDFRVTALEGAAPGGGGGATDLTPAYNYTDASSAQTLNSANSYTDASSAQTLSTANNYTDRAVAGAVAESKAYTDREIAKSEKFLSAGIAAVAAQPTLPAMTVGQKAVAVGTGHFNGANAVGVSFGFAPRDGVVLSGGVSGVSGEGKPVFRTSASYVW